MTARTLSRRITLILGLALALAGCRKPGDDPARAFRLFLDKVQIGDANGAWELLSKESQEELTELVKRRAAGSAGAIPADPKEALFGSATLAKPVEKIEVVKVDDHNAHLVVRHEGGGMEEVVMVREEGGWRLTLDPPPSGS